MADNNNTKICKDCKEEKELSNFYTGRAVCKDCNNKKRRMDNVKNLEGTKVCSVCSQEKDIKDFRPLRNDCKDCKQKKYKEYFKGHYAENKEKYKEAERIRNEKRLDEKKQNEQTTQECNYCNEVKSINDFRLNRRKCKECEKDYHKQYMKTKREDPIGKYIDNWRQNLVKISRQNKKDTNKKLYENNSYEEMFTKWLEFCFKDDMNWKNHAKNWQIDHIIPCSKLKIETENDVDICFDWKNLSPLTQKENLTKSHNILKKQVESHIESLKKFSEIYKHKKEEIDDYINNILIIYIQ